MLQENPNLLRSEIHHTFNSGVLGSGTIDAQIFGLEEIYPVTGNNPQNTAMFIDVMQEFNRKLDKFGLNRSVGSPIDAGFRPLDVSSFFAPDLGLEGGDKILQENSFKILLEVPFTMQEVIDQFVLFNNGKALFRPSASEATTYGVNEGDPYVKNSDGDFVLLQNWPTNDNYKKAILDSKGKDIGSFAFRGSGTLTKPQRIQLYVLPELNGIERSSNIEESTPLRRGKRFSILPLRILHGEVVDNGVGRTPLGTYKLINLFTDNHPMPASDGYYVFIFSFGYMTGVHASTGAKYTSKDDTRYNLFYAKVG